MKKGYARVSTLEQNIERQIRQLQDAGCELIYEEHLTGRNTDRPSLQEMLDELEPGDEILVSDLTRISRSTQDLFKLVEIIREKGAVLKSIKDTWLDTSSDNPYSNFLLTIMAGISQLEIELLKARQEEGIAIAKENGVYKGRLRRYTEKHPGLNHAIELYKAGNHTVNEICQITRISRASFYRRMKEYETNRQS